MNPGYGATQRILSIRLRHVFCPFYLLGIKLRMPSWSKSDAPPHFVICTAVFLPHPFIWYLIYHIYLNSCLIVALDSFGTVQSNSVVILNNWLQRRGRCRQNKSEPVPKSLKFILAGKQGGSSFGRYRRKKVKPLVFKRGGNLAIGMIVLGGMNASQARYCRSRKNLEPATITSDKKNWTTRLQNADCVQPSKVMATLAACTSGWLYQPPHGATSWPVQWGQPSQFSQQSRDGNKRLLRLMIKSIFNTYIISFYCYL